MIDQLELTNFKGHRETTVRFRPLTVLVGPNGSGKTSVLEALSLLSRALQGNEDEGLVGAGRLDDLLRHDESASSFAMQVTGDDAGVTQRVSVDAALREGTATSGRWETRLTINDAAYVFADAMPVAVVHASETYWPGLVRTTFLRLDAAAMTAPARAVDYARMRRTGANVAAVIANLKLADDEALTRIVEGLRRIVPSVRNVRVRPTTAGDRKSPEAAYELRFDMASGRDIPATGVSEGTLLTLALLTAIHGPTRPRLVLLDDVHEALHPTAQTALMDTLRTLTQGPEAIQVIATTHSPFILDAVEPHAVQVFALRDDGTAAVRSLAEHPEAARYTGALSSGQLWTLDDERAWVLGGAP